MSIAAYLFLIGQLEPAAVWAGLAWCALGLAIYFFYGRRHFAAAQMELGGLPPAPGPKERERMDREYRRWKWAVTLGAAAVPLLFLAGFLRR